MPFFGSDGRTGGTGSTASGGVVLAGAVYGGLLGRGDGLGDCVAEGGLEGGGDARGGSVAGSCEAGVAGLEVGIRGE